LASKERRNASVRVLLKTIEGEMIGATEFLDMERVRN